jgi:hypothetical protein
MTFRPSPWDLLDKQLIRMFVRGTGVKHVVNDEFEAT